MLRRWLSEAHSGPREIAGLAVLYGVYEVVRGAGGANLDLAQRHTEAIVSLERATGAYVELAVQHAAEGVGWLPALLGAAYMALHFGITAAVLVWAHRRRPAAFPVVRTTLVVATALALVGYLAFPAAPPRLAAGLGFADTVSSSTGVNLSSDMLGALYNPVAAVPSLHVGYALVAGLTVAALARHTAVRVAGALYPVLMLWIVVATGNHFLFDAAAGAVVVAAAFVAALALARRPEAAHRVSRELVAG